MVSQGNRELTKVAGFALLFVAAITPTLLVAIPAMEDYLDHLARMYILTTAGSSDANPYYQVSWALYPDLAMDLIIPQLARFMDVETAGRLFFFATQFLVVTGAIALELSVKRRHQISGFAALLTLYSLPFSLGLVNFEFGTGIALWGIALWITLSKKGKWWYRFLVHSISSVALFFAHFFALGIYGLVVGIFELRRLFVPRFNIQHALTTVFILACPVILLLLLMVWTGASVGESHNEWRFTEKLLWVLLFLNGYSPTLAVASLSVLAILLCYGAIKGHFSLSIDGKWIALGFLLVFIAMPFKLFDSFRMADIRMITAAFLILPAFMILTPASSQEETNESAPNVPKLSAGSIGVNDSVWTFSHFAAVVTTAIILVNCAYVGYVWVSYQNDYNALKASFSLLSPKSRVLVCSGPDRPSARPSTSAVLMGAPMRRAPTLAVYYAKALVPSLYTIPGAQVVDVVPKWHRLAINTKTETYDPPPIEALKAIAEGGNVPGTPQYIRNWPNDFDYIYVLGPHAPNAVPNILVEIASGRRFTLYSVDRSRVHETQQ
jgi:hypothetical protein